LRWPRSGASCDPGDFSPWAYQLKGNMPAMAQRRFPPAGHRLYEADDDVIKLAVAAGHASTAVR
jgi:hypothetical protein